MARFLEQTADPVRAKGIEDTAGYRYLRLAALCEVGGDRTWFGLAPETFLGRMAERSASGSGGMVTAMMHDSSRGEDVRWRLGLLTEIPERWARLVETLGRLGRPHRSRDLPDRMAEYLLYQTLVGAWPISAKRVRDDMLKAAREAKSHTSWTAPDERYEGALLAFCDGCLADPAFRVAVEEFVELAGPGRRWPPGFRRPPVAATRPASPGHVPGKRALGPGPVDPDNRGPVDFETRQRLLGGGGRVEPRAVPGAGGWEGLPKLLLISRALRLRRELPEAFAGTYLPLPTHGGKRSHLIAVLRAAAPPSPVRVKTGLWRAP